MTNKLPVVGKRFKHKITKQIYKAFKLKDECGEDSSYFMECELRSMDDLVTYLDDFWDEFEELPENQSKNKIKTSF